MLLGIIMVIIIYLKKQQEIELKVTSIKLWQEVLADAEKIKISKVEEYLLLLLQIAIVIFMVMALAKPMIYGGAPRENVTIILDNSFSMQAVSSGKSHLELAKDKGRSYISGLGEKVVVTLITANDEMNLLLEGGSKREAIQSLEAVKPSNKPLNLKAMEGINPEFLSCKIFITNKKITDMEGIITVGEDLYNLGITDVKYDYYEHVVICSIRNYSTTSIEAKVSLRDESGREYLQRKIIKGNQEEDLLIALEAEPEVIKVSLDIEDMLQQDNQYVLGIGKDYKKEVLLIGDNYYMEKALESIRGINWKKSEEIEAGYDLYIIDKKHVYEIEKPTWYLKGEEILEAEEREGTKELRIRGYESAEETLYIENPFVLEEKKGFHPVIESEGKALAIIGVEGNRRIVYSSIDLSKTNLTMTPLFPIYVEEMLYHLLDESFLKNMEPINNPPKKFIVGEAVSIVSTEKSWIPVVIQPENIFIYLAMLLLFIEWKVYKNARY